MIAKILVIDDQLSIQRMLVRQLQKIGHLALVAESGREGIEILKKRTGRSCAARPDDAENGRHGNI